MTDYAEVDLAWVEGEEEAYRRAHGDEVREAWVIYRAAMGMIAGALPGLRKVQEVNERQGKEHGYVDHRGYELDGLIKEIEDRLEDLR